MAEKLYFRQKLQTSVGRLEFRLKKLSREVWPINWTSLGKPNIVLQALIDASYTVKVFLTVFSLGLVISLVSLVYAIYLSTTKEVAAKGGEVQEGVVGGDIKVFNPVLEANSEAEIKINSLLYHPLYRVEYPDFAQFDNSQPKITPVLLAKEPEWMDSNETDPANRFKILRFTLRDNIKWSNNKPITVEDVAYTFELLKTDKANSQFRPSLMRTRIATVTGSSTQFDIISEVSNPQLIYSLNFSPISKEYYNAQILDRLVNDPRSFKPTVTSGYYTFADGPVVDPDSSNSTLKENPIRDPATNSIQTVVLSRNPVQNDPRGVYPDKYILRRYQTLFDVGGINSLSLERDSKNQKVDIYTRNLSSSLSIDDKDIQSKLGLNQKVVNSNTYYTLFLNIRVNEFFINQNLRKYVICNFLNFNLRDSFKGKLEELPREKRVVPIQLQQTYNLECGDIEKSLLDAKDTGGTKIYSFSLDEKTNIKRVLVYGKPIQITLVGLPESEPLLTDIQRYFLDMGIPADLINDNRAIRVLNDKTYNSAFLPITLVSRDLYPLYGAAGKNLAMISSNNRLTAYKPEDNLKLWSASNLTNTDARQKLIEMFSNEYISLTMFRGKNEINYSAKVNGIGENILSVVTFIEDFYRGLNGWYIERQRQFK
jgi:hypothetical protein